MEFDISFKEQWCQDGYKDASDGSAGGDQEIIGGQIFRMGSEGVKFAVADHTATEKQEGVESDNQSDVSVFFLDDSGGNKT